MPSLGGRVPAKATPSQVSFDRVSFSPNNNAPKPTSMNGWVL